MAFVEAKCTQCGGNIKVDDTKEAGICIHCGTAYITEKAINNYITTNNITHNHIQNTNIKANTVNVYQDELNKFFVVEQGTLIKYNGKLKKITIPEGIVAIGESVFESKEYSEIILPKSVELISKNAFNTTTADINYNDYSPKVIIPEDSNLIEIEDYAFYDNYTLVPRSVEKLGKVEGMIFYYGSEEEFKEKFPNHCTNNDWKKKVLCNFKNLGKKGNFLYAENDTEVYIYDVVKTEGKTLTVFGKINDKPVTSINWSQFPKLLKNEYDSYQTNFREVIFEEGLTEIGNYIWGSINSSDFTYMYIPSTVKKIGNGVINGYYLSLVEVASNIEIPQSCFYKTENPSHFLHRIKPGTGPKSVRFTIDNQTSQTVTVKRIAMFGFYKKEYNLCHIQPNTKEESFKVPSTMIIQCGNAEYEIKDLEPNTEFEVIEIKDRILIKRKGSFVCIIKPENLKNKTMNIFACGSKKMITSYGLSFEFFEDKDNEIIINSKPYELPNNHCIVTIKKKFLGADVIIENL